MRKVPSAGNDVQGKKKSRAIARRVQRPQSREVVVAEANIENRTLICSVVEKLNCVAVPVASTSEVLKVIRRRHVDLVLLDLDFDQVQMGKTNTLHEIKHLVPLLPVVIMSDVMTPALARRLCDRGAQSFLVKPVGCDQLSLTLFRYLL